MLQVKKRKAVIESWDRGYKISSEFEAPVLIPLTESGYDKPIIVLVNESTISSAEMLAAILQDFGQAKVFGVNTAGGGGGNDLLFNEEKIYKGSYAISQLFFPT